MGSIVYNSVKAAPLTNTELDNNFKYLENRSSGYLTKTLTSNYTLTSDECDNAVIDINGTLSVNITIAFQTTPKKQWLVKNNTTGGFNLYLKVSGGAVSVPCLPGYSILVSSNGTELSSSYAVQTVYLETRPANTNDKTGANCEFVQTAVSNGVSQAVSQATANQISLTVRQTVLSGPLDSNGSAAFGGSTGSTTVTTSGTLIATCAAGFNSKGAVDRIGSISNPSWTGLSTNGTMYLFLDIATDGTCTTSSSTLAPIYQYGGTVSTTNGQFTFNIQDMVGYYGNGSSSPQSYKVCVGEVVVTGGVVSAITWYQLCGRFASTWTNTLPGVSTAVTTTHKLGLIPMFASMEVECITTDSGFNVGEQTNFSTFAGSYVRNTNDPWKTKTTLGFATGGTTAFGGIKKDGAIFTPTAASWKYRFVAQRGW